VPPVRPMSYSWYIPTGSLRSRNASSRVDVANSRRSRSRFGGSPTFPAFVVAPISSKYPDQLMKRCHASGTLSSLRKARLRAGTLSGSCRTQHGMTDSNLDVPETTCESNINLSSRFSSQSDRSTAKSRSQQILVRRCSCKFFKRSKKVVRAQSGNLRQAPQVVRHAGFLVDHPHNPGNTSQGLGFAATRAGAERCAICIALAASWMTWMTSSSPVTLPAPPRSAEGFATIGARARIGGSRATPKRCPFPLASAERPSKNSGAYDTARHRSSAPCHAHNKKNHPRFPAITNPVSSIPAQPWSDIEKSRSRRSRWKYANVAPHRVDLGDRLRKSHLRRRMRGGTLWALMSLESAAIFAKKFSPHAL
jgi:hypothetical protein